MSENRAMIRFPGASHAALGSDHSGAVDSHGIKFLFSGQAAPGKGNFPGGTLSVRRLPFQHRPM